MTAIEVEPAGPRLERARGLVPELGIRSSGGRKHRVLYGTLVPFNVWVEIDSVIEGHFMESFAPGSLNKTLSEGRDRMRCIFHHGREHLGKLVLGTIIDLHADDQFAYYEVELFDSVEKESPLLLEGIAAGEYGTSIFYELIDGPLKHGVRSTYNPKGIAERAVKEAKVIEFGPTPFAVYPTAQAAMRSLTDDLLVERLTSDPERAGALLKKAGLLVPELSPREEPLTPTVVMGSSVGQGRRSVDVQIMGQTQTASGFTPHQTTRRYARAAEYVGTAVWALHPAVLATALQILGERIQGHRPSAEEITERIAGYGRATNPESRVATESPVRVIDVSGPIVPHAGMMSDVSTPGRAVEDLQAELRDAVASEDVKSILLNIDSPGGSVDLVPELAAEIRDARAVKPITAVANTFAGSAAYWLASAADEIVVTPSGEVGSIGVYAAHEDISALQEIEGKRTTLISAGEYKVEGNPFEPLTEEARVEMQSKVDGFYKMFVKGVAVGRGVSTKVVEETFGQGRMVMAEDAVGRGMADRVATFSQTLARLEKAASTTSTSTKRAAAALPAGPEENSTRDEEPQQHSDHSLFGEKEREPWKL